MTQVAARVKQRASTARTPRVGRPPRVSLPEILAAAREIGLDRVTLKQVADRLDIGIATLYRHVRSRDELVRLAAFELMLARRLPDRAHAHWTEVASSYAETLYEAFVAEPQLIGELLKGSLGPHAEIDILEQFLGALRTHGFSTEEGVALFHAIGTVMIGAAAGAIGQKASRESGEPWNRAMRRVLSEREPSDLPLVRKVFPQALDRHPHQWRPALHALLAGFETIRKLSSQER